MGMYPRKGAIAPGSDADICILDPGLRRTVQAASMHEADYSPWEGRQVDAWPAMTILRGKIVSGALGTSVTLSVGTDVSLKDDLAAETTAADEFRSEEFAKSTVTTIAARARTANRLLYFIAYFVSDAG